jgi:hypothetical protein
MAHRLMIMTLCVLILFVGSGGITDSDAVSSTMSQQTGDAGRPPGLQPTQVDITNDTTHRYGEPELAVNPKNPNNLVYMVMQEAYTYACQASHDPACVIPVPGRAPIGLLTVPGFIYAKVFVSFNRGKTWANVNFPGFVPGHPDLLSISDPMVTVTADGTFYIAWNDMHMTTMRLNGILDGGLAVSKSIDGGLTWSEPTLTGTPNDRPFMTTDFSTGKIYVASGSSPVFGNLGPTSTADPTAPVGAISDRWLVSSPDGVTWTTPERFGGGGVPGFPASASDTFSAAHGVLAATFRSTDAMACAFFVSTSSAPCTVFQTTTDSGSTWTRHRIPVPSDSTGQVLVAADPAVAGTYTVAVLNSSGGEFLVYVTHDSGDTWSGPATLTDNPNTTKFKAWINYSPLLREHLDRGGNSDRQPAHDEGSADQLFRDHGILGLMWRSNDSSPGGPYKVFAAISNDHGLTWSDPLQVSTASSPAPDPTQVALDDESMIVLDKQDAFIAWADWRPGDVQGFFSAVKLQRFHFRHH